MNSLWQWFHSLTPKKLEHSLRVLGNPSSFTKLFIHYPGCLQFLQFKAETVAGFYRQTRQLINTMRINHAEVFTLLMQKHTILSPIRFLRIVPLGAPLVFVNILQILKRVFPRSDHECYCHYKQG